jgi:hypothetical protein
MNRQKADSKRNTANFDHFGNSLRQAKLWLSDDRLIGILTMNGVYNIGVLFLFYCSFSSWVMMIER